MPYDTIATIEFFKEGETVSLRSEPDARIYIAHDAYPNGSKGVIAELQKFKAKVDMFVTVFGPIPVSPELVAAMFQAGRSGRMVPEAGGIDVESRFLYRLGVGEAQWMLTVFTPTFRRDGKLKSLEYMFSSAI